MACDAETLLVSIETSCIWSWDFALLHQQYPCLQMPELLTWEKKLGGLPSCAKLPRAVLDIASLLHNGPSSSVIGSRFMVVHSCREALLGRAKGPCRRQWRQSRRPWRWLVLNTSYKLQYVYS